MRRVAVRVRVRVGVRVSVGVRVRVRVRVRGIEPNVGFRTPHFETAIANG